MIYINPHLIQPGAEWQTLADNLTVELKTKPEGERSDFIDSKRRVTWGDPTLLETLRRPVGNKCWYSEVPLEGDDPNVDHFRPKGRVREVDDNFQNTAQVSTGYWWLAFELRNFRLACTHSNQRRVDDTTEGGKSDYLPVIGPRAVEGTDWDLIEENIIPLDPCSASDLHLLWFSSNGEPGVSEWRNKKTTDADKKRVKATIWLYHLNKADIQAKRRKHVDKMHLDLRTANTHYKLWNPQSDNPNLISKRNFDEKIAEIRNNVSDYADFAGAKRCIIRSYIVKYAWIEELEILT
jgi:hypothetical protein